MSRMLKAMFLDGFPGTPAGGAPAIWEMGTERALINAVNVTIGDMAGAFADEAARASMPTRAIVYATQVVRPEPEGTEGGLFYGHTLMMPGQVGNEYFMTRGHFHLIRDRAEFYWCQRGEGILILMSENREYRVEPMRAGSVHYVPGRVAHRTVNTGHEVLSFTACWPSDAGHDYGSIATQGFPVRVLCLNEHPTLVEAA